MTLEDRYPSKKFNKQTPEEVKRGMLRQALLASIRSWRGAIGSTDSGSDRNPNVANVIEDTLTKAVVVINTVANVGSLGSDNSNQSLQDDVAMQGDSDKIGSQTNGDIYILLVQRTSEKLTVLSSNSSESNLIL